MSQIMVHYVLCNYVSSSFAVTKMVMVYQVSQKFILLCHHFEAISDIITITLSQQILHFLEK